MSDAQWAEYRKYADRVTIWIRPVKLPGDEHSDGDRFIIADGAAWDQDWLVREIESIAFAGEYSASYALDFRESRTSWGAAGATYEIVLQIAQWATTSATWDALKLVAGRMAERLAGKRDHNTRPVTEEEAEGRATWIASTQYGEDYQSLQVQSIEVRNETAATVELVGSKGWRYEFDIELENNLVALVRTKKSRIS